MADQEVQAAAAFYDDTANEGKSFSHKVYNRPEVNQALTAAFHNKCAYCETPIGPGSEADIEHWRPKGVIKQLDGSRVRPGYFWLAASWDNLLLSCLRCNRVRRYRKDGNHESKAEWQTLGKGELFPVEDPRRIARRKGQERREKPLLLDPCKNKVDGYFEFVVDPAMRRMHGIIRPRYATGQRNLQAEVSIKVFGLNRPSLVRERRKTMIGVIGELKSAEFAITTFGEATTAAKRQRAGAEVDRTIKVIVDRFNPDAEYQLLVRTVVREYLKRHPHVAGPLKAALGGG